jgi:hypothetical protein
MPAAYTGTRAFFLYATHLAAALAEAVLRVGSKSSLMNRRKVKTYFSPA